MPEKNSTQYLSQAIFDAELAAELYDRGGEEGCYNLVESDWRQHQANTNALISIALKLDKLSRLIEDQFRGILPP